MLFAFNRHGYVFNVLTFYLCLVCIFFYQKNSIEYASGNNCDDDSNDLCFLQLIGTFHVATKIKNLPFSVSLEGELDISSTAIPACGGTGNEGESFFQSLHCGHLKLFTTYFHHWVQSVMAKPDFAKQSLLSVMREKSEIMAEHGRAADDEDMYGFIEESNQANKNTGPAQKKMHPLFRAGKIWNTLFITKVVPAMRKSNNIRVIAPFYQNRAIMNSADDTTSTTQLNQFEYECIAKKEDIARDERRLKLLTLDETLKQTRQTGSENQIEKIARQRKQEIHLYFYRTYKIHKYSCYLGFYG